ncbi:CGNR zinc finger domain-containing protein [Paraburkholderia sp. BR14320]|uniref:CGNR zinc finger domain-containing protein n=1 Tax=unclassified Paraburkholderia TaxID=2615204 RepID=UPI0034CFC0FA
MSMVNTASQASSAFVVTEDPCIPFVNTVAWRLTGEPQERLESARSLLVVLREQRLVDDGLLRAYRAQWKSDPRAADNAYRLAIEAREAIYAALYGAAREKKTPADLSLLFRLLSVDTPGATLLHRNGRYVWSWDANALRAAALIRPFVVSALGLLTGPRAKRIKQCEDARGCGWLFVDESRAQNRRWCSMGDCGNCAKARRNYARGRESS